MQVRPQEFKNIILTGVFVTALLILTGASIFFLGKENSVFEKKINLIVEVENAQNLKNGAFIQFKGIKIGTVTNIKVATLETIHIHLEVRKDMQKWIKKDSYVTFRTEGVLGDKFLEILGGTSDSNSVSSGDFLNVKHGPDFKKFLAKGDNILATATSVLVKLDLMLDAIDPIKLSSTLENINTTSQQSKKIFSAVKVEEVRKLSSSITSINESMKSFSNITKQIEKGPGAAHSFIYDTTTHQQVKELLGGANRSKVLKYFLRESVKED